MLDIGRFDLTNEFNLLRIICGAFFIPHSVGKIIEWKFSVGFFAKAGFAGPEWWTRAALLFEAVVASCLILGIYTRYAAILGAIFLAVAAMACYRVSGRRSMTSLYSHVFCCVIVAMHG